MNHKQSQTYTPPNLIAGLDCCMVVALVLDIGTTKVCKLKVDFNELEIYGKWDNNQYLQRFNKLHSLLLLVS